MTHTSDRRALILASICALALSACQPVKPVDLPPGIDVELRFLSSGQILWNGERIDLPELRRRAATLASNNPDAVISLAPDKGSPFGTVTESAASLQRAGLNNLVVIGGT